MSAQPELATPTDDPDRDPAGAKRAGDYVLVRRIGSGGMGEVWLGRHVLSGSLGAVKRIGRAGQRTAIVGAYFAREGRAITRLDHPHIVPLIDIGADYLVTAFVDGGDLARRLQTPIAPAAALHLARQIADALVHAHDRGVVHRDVKPSNVLVDRRGNAYLTDFGLAALVDDPDDPRPGAGTPLFMAPEQRRGEPAGPAADQYALGRTLLEMLIGGRVPLDRESALAELPAGLPDPLRALLERATAARAEDRFPSMRALADALAAIVADHATPPRRLAPILRDPDAFRWAAGAHAVVDVGPDVSRADYRLRDLVDAGLLPRDDVDEVLDRAGLADIGFAAWGDRGRLGALTAADALTRATDVVILLHGFGHTREAWGSLARAVCRDNAQALVLAPDVHGFGETRFRRTPTIAQASMVGLARAVDDWRRLLGVATIPTALVGHSMCGLALLTIDDDGAGLRVARIAVTPTLASHDPALCRRFRNQARLAATIGRIAPLRRWFIRRSATRVEQNRHLVPEAARLMAEEIARMPGGVLHRVARAIGDAPPRLGRQSRVAVVVAVDDPLMDFAALDRAIADVGIAPEHVHRFPDGGHHPHVESAAHPEWSARNGLDLARVIDAMLVSAAEAPVLDGDSPVGLDSTVQLHTTVAGSSDSV